MKIIKCAVCGKYFAATKHKGGRPQKYCSNKCTQKAFDKQNQKLKRQREAFKRYMQRYHNNTLEQIDAVARERGITYGMLQTERQRELVKIEFPEYVKKSTEYDRKRQEFLNLVEAENG